MINEIYIVKKIFNVYALITLSFILTACGAGSDVNSNANVTMSISTQNCTNIGSSSNLCSITLQYNSDSVVTLNITPPNAPFIMNQQTTTCPLTQQVNGSGTCSIYVSCQSSG